MLDDIVEKTIASPDGKKQTLYIYQRPITQEEMIVHVSGAENIEQIKAENKEKYKNDVEIPWNEGTLHVKGRDASKVDLRNLEVIVSSAMHSQAIRNHQTVEDEMPVTVIGVVESSDGYIIMAVRRGAVQGNQSCVVPLGYADYDKHPVEQFRDEGIEEVGIPVRAYEKVVVIGFQTDPDFTNGLNIVVYAKSTLTREEIVKLHGDASQICQAAQREALEKGELAFKARKAGVAAVKAYNEKYGKELPVNAGDHYPVDGVKKEDIETIIANQGFSVRNNAGNEQFYKIMGNSLGALEMYVDCERRGVL